MRGFSLLSPGLFVRSIAGCFCPKLYPFSLERNNSQFFPLTWVEQGGGQVFVTQFLPRPFTGPSGLYRTPVLTLFMSDPCRGWIPNFSPSPHGTGM